MKPRRVHATRGAAQEVVRNIVSYLRDHAGQLGGEVTSIALAHALGTHFNRQCPNDYVSVEEIAAQLVSAKRLLGRVHEGAWLRRLSEEVTS